MAYREKENEEHGRYYKPKKDRLSIEGLREFAVEHEQYMETHENGLRIFNETKWLKDKGGLSQSGRVVVTGFTSKKHQDCDPIRYEQLLADLEQYREWKGRKEYGERKRLELLETTARS